MQYVLAEDRKWDRVDRIAVFLLILMPCALRLWIQVPLDNDTFFLLSHGRHVFQHGLPTIEPFTFHEGLRFVMQQWLSASIFYYIYNLFGYTGLYILAYIIYLLYGYFTYKLSMLISNENLPVSATTSLLVCIGMGFFIVLRPWIFSGLIFVIEIYCLELFIKRSSSYYLIYMPILSVALINLHAAVWPIFYIIMIPYILDGFKINLGLVKCHGYKFLPILVSGSISFLAGFLNPYTTDAILYLYHSYGNEYVNSVIDEMKVPDVKNMGGIIIFGMYLFVILSYSMYKVGTSRIRYFLLTLLTAYMGLSSARGIQYFFIIAFPFLAYYYRNFDILAATHSYKKTDIYTYIKLVTLTAICITIIGFAPRHTEKDIYDKYGSVNAVDYMVQHLDTNHIRLFNDYDVGNFLEFKGIKTFIDTRADVFLKSNNKKADILNDYMDTLIGRIHYKDFLDMYEFSHLLTIRGSLMDTYLSRDSTILLLYEDEKFRLFERKKVSLHREGR